MIIRERSILCRVLMVTPRALCAIESARVGQDCRTYVRVTFNPLVIAFVAVWSIDAMLLIRAIH